MSEQPYLDKRAFERGYEAAWGIGTPYNQYDWYTEANSFRSFVEGYAAGKAERELKETKGE